MEEASTYGFCVAVLLWVRAGIQQVDRSGPWDQKPEITLVYLGGNAWVGRSMSQLWEEEEEEEGK